MAPDVKRNIEFARWFEAWIASTQHDRVSNGYGPPEKTSSPDEQEDPAGASTVDEPVLHVEAILHVRIKPSAPPRQRFVCKIPQ